MSLLVHLLKEALSIVVTFLAREDYICYTGCVALANLARCSDHFYFMVITARVIERADIRLRLERTYFEDEDRHAHQVRQAEADRSFPHRMQVTSRNAEIGLFLWHQIHPGLRFVWSDSLSDQSSIGDCDSDLWSGNESL